MSVRRKIVLTVIITAIATCIVTLAACGAAALMLTRDSDGGLAAKIEMLELILDRRYLYDYDKQALGDEALHAYIDALDEPYTEYFSAEEFSSYKENLMDGYIGIGVIVGVNDDDRIVVIAPFEDSPAYNAGIMPGDILKAVDGTDYRGSELSEAVNAIKNGKEGTAVNITILRDGEEMDFTITRSDISNDSVKAEMLDDDTGYIRITEFNMESENGRHSTSTEFESKLTELSGNGMKKLIIDLRDNPGGILPEVCEVADMLLPEGTIVYTEDKNGKGQTYTSDADFNDVPIVVLINENSASASEVLTGALKDYGRAVIVGKTSYGKGIVQDVYPLLDGSGISLTTARYYTPNGICIHGIGIEPDVEVDMPEEYKNTYASMVEHDKDTQLQKAIEIIKEK